MSRIIELLSGIKESKINWETAAKIVADNTDSNAHSENYVYIAKDILKDKKLTGIFENILSLHHLEGFLPPEIKKYRDRWSKVLITQGKKKFGDDFIQQIIPAL